MINQSLNSIMNEMARNTDIVCSSRENAPQMDPLSEIEAFAVLDETLDFLNKQYLEAKAQRKELVALGGAEDAMAVVAVDMEDSAWCAMQTRYIEVRADRQMMARAQQMMRQRARQIEELNQRILQSDKMKQAHDFVNYLKILEVMKEKNKTPRIFEWLFAFMFLGIDIFGQRPNQNSYTMPVAA